MLDFERWNGFLCNFRRFSILFSFIFLIFLRVCWFWIHFFFDAYCPGDCRFCWNATFKYEAHTALITQYIQPHSYIRSFRQHLKRTKKLSFFAAYIFCIRWYYKQFTRIEFWPMFVVFCSIWFDTHLAHKLFKLFLLQSRYSKHCLYLIHFKACF